MREITEAALRLAAARKPVFPCWPDKTPRTANGFHGATRDPMTIRHWFESLPDALLAIPTGRASGWVVVDVDGDDGADALHELERRREPLPRTATNKTPRGGCHYFFRHPGVEVPCSVERLGPQIDIRADGGYCVVPPSRLPDGRGYEPDEQAPVAALPRWFLKLLVGAPGGGERGTAPAGEWAALVRDGVNEGARNSQLARLCGHLLRRDVGADLVAELAALVNEQRFRPPLDRAEVERVVASIAAADARRRRGGPKP